MACFALVKFGARTHVSPQDAETQGLPSEGSSASQRSALGHRKMTSRTAAARYARAALDVATKESADLEQLARELDEFIAFFTQQPALKGLMLNPAVPAPRKRAAMEQITQRRGLHADRLEAAHPAGRSRPPLPARGHRRGVSRFAGRSAERRSRRSDQRGAPVDRPPSRDRAAARDADRQARVDDDEGRQGHHRRGRRARRQHGVRREHRDAVEEDSRRLTT